MKSQRESELITKPSLQYNFLPSECWLVAEYLMLIPIPVQQLTGDGVGGRGGVVFLKEAFSMTWSFLFLIMALPLF